jgi:hypothetical protein
MLLTTHCSIKGMHTKISNCKYEENDTSRFPPYVLRHDKKGEPIRGFSWEWCPELPRKCNIPEVLLAACKGLNHSKSWPCS